MNKILLTVFFLIITLPGWTANKMISDYSQQATPAATVKILIDEGSGSYKYSTLANIAATMPTITVTGGLNVGTATGAGAGEIRAGVEGIAIGSIVDTYGSRIFKSGTTDLILGIPGQTSSQFVKLCQSDGDIVHSFDAAGNVIHTGGLNVGSATGAVAGEGRFSGLVSANAFWVGGTTLNVPDYVFEPKYKKMPLETVEKYIYIYQHLPYIPDQAEIQKSGLSLADMDMKLLEKIELLYLYVIDLNKEVMALQSIVAEQKVKKVLIDFVSELEKLMPKKEIQR